MDPSSRLRCIRSRSQEFRDPTSLLDAPMQFNATPHGQLSPRFLQNYSLASFRSGREDVKPTTLKEKCVRNLTLESFYEEDGSRPIFTDLDKYELPEPSEMQYLKEQFGKKRNSVQNTLVIEIIGTMVNCLNPIADENFSVFDVTISGNKLLKVEKAQSTETLFVRFHA